MKHLEALRILPRYFEGNLDRETTRAFHEHINHCTDCRDQIKLMRQFKDKGLARQTQEADQPRSAGRKPRRLAPPQHTRPGRKSHLNANDMKSRQMQRALIMKFLLAAGLFFVAVRSGLIARLFQ